MMLPPVLPAARALRPAPVRAFARVALVASFGLAIACETSYRPTPGHVVIDAMAAPESISGEAPSLPGDEGEEPPIGIFTSDPIPDGRSLLGRLATHPEACVAEVGRTFEPVYFRHDSSILSFGARDALREYAGWLAERPEVWITVEGHCDLDGSSEYNYHLGMSRATAVRDYLAGQGIAPERMFLLSFGEERPVAEGEGEDVKALNRRTEFRAVIPPEGMAAAGATFDAPPSGPPPEPLAPAPPPPGEEMP